MAKIGKGFDIKDGKVVAIQRQGLSASERIRQRKSKRTRVAKKGTIVHGKPKGSDRARGQPDD